jgi:hypothetical protein
MPSQALAAVNVLPLHDALAPHAVPAAATSHEPPAAQAPVLPHVPFALH